MVEQFQHETKRVTPPDTVTELPSEAIDLHQPPQPQQPFGVHPVQTEGTPNMHATTKNQHSTQHVDMEPEGWCPKYTHSVKCIQTRGKCNAKWNCDGENRGLRVCSGCPMRACRPCFRRQNPEHGAGNGMGKHDEWRRWGKAGAAGTRSVL
jgi:hypothetical protein